MIEAARTYETSVDNCFTRQYIPEDKSELHTHRRANLKCHRVRDISVHHHVQTGCDVHSASCKTGTGELAAEAWSWRLGIEQPFSIFLAWRNPWNNFQVSGNPCIKIIISAAHGTLAWSVSCRYNNPIIIVSVLLSREWYFCVDLFILANKFKKRCLFFFSITISRGTLGFRGIPVEKPWYRIHEDFSATPFAAYSVARVSVILRYTGCGSSASDGISIVWFSACLRNSTYTTSTSLHTSWVLTLSQTFTLRGLQVYKRGQII
jgi:hypothetical protein